MDAFRVHRASGEDGMRGDQEAGRASFEMWGTIRWRRTTNLLLATGRMWVLDTIRGFRCGWKWGEDWFWVATCPVQRTGRQGMVPFRLAGGEAQLDRPRAMPAGLPPAVGGPMTMEMMGWVMAP